jgi:hypothetical protein
VERTEPLAAGSLVGCHVANVATRHGCEKCNQSMITMQI